MASVENGATQLLPLWLEDTSFDDDRGTTQVTASPTTTSTAQRDDVDTQWTSLGTPPACVPPERVVYYNVTYDMPSRSLCGCFARDP